MPSLIVAPSTPQTIRRPRETVSVADRSRRSESGLDWFAFFCANLQTGFGPFVSVYLTTEKWTQTDIGLVLMIGGLVGLAGQIPGGALVDRMRSKTLVAGISVALVGVAGVIIATSAFFPVILLAWVLHAAASCMLSPAISTVSLALVGHEGIGRRLGRNATFASVGSALAAGGMGAVGYYVSNQAVFFVTAALAVPALLALVQIVTPQSRGAGTPRGGIRARETAAPRTVVSSPVSPRPTSPAPTSPDPTSPAPTSPSPSPSPSPSSLSQSPWADLKSLAGERAILVLIVAIVLYYLSNAAILPLIGSMLTLRSSHSPTLLIAACIIVPQVVVAVLSPIVGRSAQTRGRRPLLILGLAALPMRALVLALVTNPVYLVAVQVLDGLTSAVVGVVVPLVAADATRGTGRFALAQGVLGTAMGLGASFSASFAGLLTDRFGSSFAFFGLTTVGVGAVLVVLVCMPETRELGSRGSIG